MWQEAAHQISRSQEYPAQVFRLIFRTGFQEGLQATLSSRQSGAVRSCSQTDNSDHDQRYSGHYFRTGFRTSGQVLSKRQDIYLKAVFPTRAVPFKATPGNFHRSPGKLHRRRVCVLSKLAHAPIGQGQKQEIAATDSLEVVIADRDPMSSDLLANMLRQQHRCSASAVHSTDLMQYLAARAVHLVVIASEHTQSSRSGSTLADTVRRAHPGLALVVILDKSTQESVVNAFRAGARGVFSRNQPVSELVDCIERVRQGCIWADGEATEFLLETLRSIPAPRLSSCMPALTTRELEVVECAAKGKTNRSIAVELGLSEHTVKNYLFRAFEKLGVSSRVELLFYLTLQGHRFHGHRARESFAGLKTAEVPAAAAGGLAGEPARAI